MSVSFHVMTTYFLPLTTAFYSVCMECKVRYFLLYANSTEVHFNFIHYLFMCMACHIFFQTKEFVVNVYDYFKELSRCKQTQRSLKQTSDATGVSCTRIKRLWKEVDIGRAAFSTPLKRYRHSRCLLVYNFDPEAII